MKAGLLEESFTTFKEQAKGLAQDFIHLGGNPGSATNSEFGFLGGTWNQERRIWGIPIQRHMSGRGVRSPRE